MSADKISLIGLDWGSTHLRAFAFDRDGGVIDKSASGCGAMKLASADAFERALQDVIGAWCAADSKVPIIACGMVGARGAWVEAGYVGVNADAAELASHAVNVECANGQTLRVIPGVKSAEPDVMRGEETQIVGANIGEGVVALPGTHSKWVRVSGGRISDFKTCFTGEINALIRESSSVGKALALPPSLDDAEAIARGIACAREHRDWLHQLFLFRASVVTGSADAQAASSEFSAWLIASEFEQMKAIGLASDAISLIASEQLAPWYCQVAEAFEMHCTVLDGERCVADGLWRIASEM